MKNVSLPTPRNFNFLSTVFSHGWCALPPFAVDRERRSLKRVLTLDGRPPVVAHASQTPAGRLRIAISDHAELSSEERATLIRQMSTCLRLDEEFDEFYGEAARHAAFRWVVKKGAGRMLRAPSVFEDVVKMLCTTNCSWGLTEIMVANLCRNFGTQLGEDQYSFPVPEAIAESSEKFLRKEIKSGYRSPFLLELSRRVARGELDPEQWRTSDLPDGELFEEVRSVKGIGPYAAGNILKLLGRYEFLGVDSWSRAKFAELHNGGRKVSDKRIDRHYHHLGRWKGLFFWLDVTKEWYRREFPF